MKMKSQMKVNSSSSLIYLTAQNLNQKYPLDIANSFSYQEMCSQQPLVPSFQCVLERLSKHILLPQPY